MRYPLTPRRSSASEDPAAAGFSVSLSGDDDETLRGYWDALANSGEGV